MGLSYRTHETDFGALARELHGGEDEPTSSSSEDDLDDEHDEWADYATRSERD